MALSAYHIIFKRHWKEIVCYCNKRVGNLDVAKDLAQHAFIALHNNWGKIEEDRHAKAFVYLCAKNATFNHIETVKRHRTVSLDLIKEDGHEEVPRWDFDLIETEVITFIFEQIELLPEGKQKIMKLFFKGIDSNTIAKRIGIARKTVLNQKLTAIAQLKAAVKLKFHI